MSEPSPAPSAPDAPTNDATESVVPATVLPLMRLLPPPPEGTILTPPEHQDPPRRSWFLIELWQEMRLAVRMYFDPHYRVSRLAQIAFPLFFGLLIANYFLFSWFSIPVVSPVAERLCNIILAVLAYRVLVRELARYRAVIDYLARYTQR